MATAQSPAPASHGSWVAGRELVGEGGRRSAISPATGEPFAEVSLLSAAQVGEAMRRAVQAFPGWSRTSFDERRARMGPRAGAYS